MAMSDIVDHNKMSQGSSQVMPVAVDAMGSDHGPRVMVEGAVQAYKEIGATSILVGPKEDLSSILASLGASDLPIYIRHAPQIIEMDDSPVRSVRRKPDASLCVAYDLLNRSEVSAMLSAGNSGAMMAAGKILCGLVPGIERPAIATIIPVAGIGKPNVVLDSGANVDCHAQNLVQFAVMGSIYYSSLFGVTNPRVALLSNGTEPSKGTDVVRAAAATLSQLETINYIGFVEGRDATVDKVDVVVCDGFVGNVLLKATEGAVRLVYEQLKHEAKRSLIRKLGATLFKGALSEVFSHKFDYTAYGGAPLLGLSKLAFVLHGSSDARAVKSAIRLAHTFATNGMTQKIIQELTSLEDRLHGMSDEGVISLKGLVHRE
jgi:glycerol-3-phosphate acyltransferase PlsX